MDNANGDSVSIVSRMMMSPSTPVSTDTAAHTATTTASTTATTSPVASSHPINSLHGSEYAYLYLFRRTDNGYQLTPQERTLAQSWINSEFMSLVSETILIAFFAGARRLPSFQGTFRSMMNVGLVWSTLGIVTTLFTGSHKVHKFVYAPSQSPLARETRQAMRFREPHYVRQQLFDKLHPNYDSPPMNYSAPTLESLQCGSAMGFWQRYINSNLRQQLSHSRPGTVSGSCGVSDDDGGGGGHSEERIERASGDMTMARMSTSSRQSPSLSVSPTPLPMALPGTTQALAANQRIAVTFSDRFDDPFALDVNTGTASKPFKPVHTSSSSTSVNDTQKDARQLRRLERVKREVDRREYIRQLREMNGFAPSPLAPQTNAQLLTDPSAPKPIHRNEFGDPVYG